jgi:hypothetical protein
MKTPDHFNKATAEKLGIDLKIVKEVNTYFWRYGVKRNLSEANYNAIFIKNFGTITVSRHKLRTEIRKVINDIRGLETYYKQDQKEELKERLYIKLKRLCERRNEIAHSFSTHKRKWDKPKL